MKVLTVVGNRPQFVKAAAVSRHLRALAAETLVHSGQHYDHGLSGAFFEELDLAPPDQQLGVGSGSHGEQTATIMRRLEPLLLEQAHDAVLVYGDTNTTLAASLVAAKLPVGLIHIEAGMRSYDRRMPEETNRVVADRLCGLRLCSTPQAVANLASEGIADARLVGDVMADVALELAPAADRRRVGLMPELGVEPDGYLLATVHRAGNVDDPASLAAVLQLLTAAAEVAGPVVWPLHPRTRARLISENRLAALEADDRFVITEPLGYLDFACLLRAARAVLTDSGGAQKEAFLAATPCVTLRTETEWTETVEAGWNRLVGLDADLVVEAIGAGEELRGSASPASSEYGRGEAGRRCAEEIAAWLGR